MKYVLFFIITLIGITLIGLFNIFLTNVKYKHSLFITEIIWCILILNAGIRDYSPIVMIVILVLILFSILMTGRKSSDELIVLVNRIKHVLRYIGLICFIISVGINVLYLRTINKSYSTIVNNTTASEVIDTKLLNVTKIFPANMKMTVVTGFELIDMSSNLAKEISVIIANKNNTEYDSALVELVDMSMYDIKGLPECISIHKDVTELLNGIGKIADNKSYDEKLQYDEWVKTTVDTIMYKVKLVTRILSMLSIIEFIGFIYFGRVIIYKIAIVVIKCIKSKLRGGVNK